MSPKVGRNPDGSYLMELGTPDPCSMGVVRNDVQHASYFNRGYEAIEILCGRINAIPDLPDAMIVLPWEMTEGVDIPTGLKGEAIYMGFAGRINLRALRGGPSAGNLVLDVLKNGVSICAAAIPTLVGSRQSVDTTLTGWSKDFAIGDTLQASVLSVSGISAYALTLMAERL